MSFFFVFVFDRVVRVNRRQEGYPLRIMPRTGNDVRGGGTNENRITPLLQGEDVGVEGSWHEFSARSDGTNISNLLFLQFTHNDR